MTPAVEIQQLSLRIGDKTILDGIDLQIEAGSFFVIIGPNGAGKTSLLKTLAGLLHPGSGNITVAGRRINEYSRRQLAQTVAMVPQRLSSIFPFTVSEYVLLGRAPHLGLFGFETRRDFEIAARAMEATDVEHLADRRLDQLSGGELQRAVIARAICQQPTIVLLDEPTAALDPAHQLRLMDLMERFRRDSAATVIMVSHDLNLAAMYGDAVALLQAGTLRGGPGPPGEVFTADRLSDCYGCRITVDKSCVPGIIRVTPVPEKFVNLNP